MAVVLVTGASGLLGRSVTRKLQAGGHVVKTLTTRQVNKDATQNAFLWNISTGYIEQEALDGVECIIHLAGANIGANRWTRSNRKNIIDSRVASANLLLNSLKQRGQRIIQFISASGTGFYPDPSNEVMEENHTPGNGFLSEICVKWEAAAQEMEGCADVVTILRLGPIISKEGGLLPVAAMTLPLRIIPVLGSPRNVLSWIHIEDAANIICFSLEKHLGGTFNATAPNPATQQEFTKAIAQTKLCFFPLVPSFLLKLLLGDRAALPLTDQKVSSHKIQEHGYQFQFSNIDTAMKQMMYDKK